MPLTTILSGGLGTGVGGKVLQVKRTESSSTISSSSTIPYDDTDPTSSEGVEILSLSFTPISATADLHLFFTIFANENANVGDRIALPVFKGTTLIGVGYQNATYGSSSTNWIVNNFSIKHSPASTSAATYSVRGGVNAGTFESLGSMTYMENAKYGANIVNSMTIMEIEP
tara:strand:+ start:4468 stop:4980 length:513 start_codon:yes stop_codon:yes gene_type:complete